MKRFRTAFTIIPAISLAASLIGAPLASAALPANSSDYITAAAATTAAKKITLKVNGNSHLTESAPFISQNSVYMPLREVGELLGAMVSWNAAAKTVTMSYPGHLITLKVGSTEAINNGKKIKLLTPLQVIKGHVYVPLRFFSESIGASVTWKQAENTVGINQKVIYQTGGSMQSGAVWIDPATGNLYTALGKSDIPKPAGKLNIDPELSGYWGISTKVIGTNGLMVTVLFNYGEPGIQYRSHAAYIKDNKLVKQATAQYYQRYEPNIVAMNNNPLLTDGKTLSLLDSSGATLEEYDLPKLGGKDEVYAVLGMGQGYLIIRPNKTGLLTLVDLKTGTATLLYKQFLSTAEQEYAEMNDIPYHGDELAFTGETSKGVLSFSYRSALDGKSYTYSYSLNKA
ncbi:Copper amine oxidase N-terminal domain-containing protein [Paenibacillus algorifonticola]|uniref:Copper amine oxidase N-terminal domain-containing protein n=1 Tax=Paenibacillus algorifonticola TaxID=684063 RepID=A0A1I2BE48_9BACL|nr:copper amine oxidase N-terminal domain-containing protein [Paenibacillus algorifonticola]SFE54441.1 Copper amine oxidase N-terminal domain-containing protein [Paenibacillus algorifonticola]